MAKTRIDDILRPLAEKHQQVYFGTGLHTLGLIRWILQQIGPSKIIITTFSTSDQFLRGFRLMRDERMIESAILLLDLKATKKTAALKTLMKNCFDSVYLGENHSKVIILYNDNHAVFVNSSLNQTYGGRNECTTITDDNDIICNAMRAILDCCAKSYCYDIHERAASAAEGVR